MIAQFLNELDLPWDTWLIISVYISLTIIYIGFKIVGIEIVLMNKE